MRKPPNEPSSEKPREDSSKPSQGEVARESDVEEIEFAEADESLEPDALAEAELIEEGEENAEVFVAELIEDDEEPAAESKAEAEKPEAEPEPPPPPPPPRKIILLGAGHAHLQILKWWRKRPIRGTELTLVTAFDQAAFSSMLPATLAGMYQRHEMLVDLPKLCEHCGVRLIVDRANRLDPQKRVIEFAHQPSIEFDVASINMGSVPAAEPLWQSHRIMISVKPLSTFLQRFEVRFRELVEQWRMAPGPELLQIVVVGAGAAGVELALCLEQHKHELELPADVRLVDGHPALLPEFAPRSVRRIEKLLKLRGIDLSLGSPVEDCDDEGAAELVLANGQRIRADLVIWAAGAAPPMALRGFELPKTERGFLSTRSTLQTTEDAPVFVVGDTADFDEFEIPKSAAYAVHQAPLLWKNLRRFLAEKPLREYRPKSRVMRLLSCGDGTAIFDYNGYTSHSHWAWTLKNWMDRRWIRQFQIR